MSSVYGIFWTRLSRCVSSYIYIYIVDMEALQLRTFCLSRCFQLYIYIWLERHRDNLVQNIPYTELSTVDMKALQFAEGVKNHNLLNWININYRENDADFDKGFTEELITTTNNIYIDDCVLLWRHRDVLRGMSKNYFIIITSDISRGVDIMDFIHYNNKIIELLDDKNKWTNFSANHN